MREIRTSGATRGAGELPLLPLLYRWLFRGFRKCYIRRLLMSFQDHPYADFLHEVSKPARYVGGELFSVAKDWDTLDAKMVLAFPDVYDIGMSHQGTKNPVLHY